MCACTGCKNSRRVLRSIRSGSRKQIEREFERLMMGLDAAELDNQVNNEIMKGRWPGSVGILERALARAKENETLGHDNVPIDSIPG